MLSIKENLTSINQFPDRFGYKVEGVVLHSCVGYYKGSISWFRNKDAKASAHYVISKTGEISLCVEEKAAAWATGNVTVQREKAPKLIRDRWGVNPNFITISIEYEDERNKKWNYPKAQYDAGVELVADICKRYSITPDSGVLIAHREIDPINRSDPIGSWNQELFISDVKKLMGYDSEVKTMLVIAPAGLNVRALPKREKKSLGLLKYGDKVEVIEQVKGEVIDGNGVWGKTISGNYVWMGGLEEISGEKGGKMITKAEFEAKKALLDEMKVSLDERAKEVEEEAKDLAEDMRKYTEDLAVLEAKEIEPEVVAEPAPVEAVVEPVVEPVKEVKTFEVKEDMPTDVKSAIAHINSLIEKYGDYLK
jgi:N-acetyl-anhydromuramyl-L-alanine amidase AmpD